MTHIFILSLFILTTSAVAVSAPRWDFQSDPVGALPAGWSARGGSAAAVYKIEAEPDGNHFLAARSHRSDVQFGTEVTLKGREYPTLSWRWRVWELPRNGDERKTETMDSAASVYVVFGSRLFPKILKYVWSSSLPAGTVLRHPRYDSMAIVVVASGRPGLGRWQKVSRDLGQDCQAIFGTGLSTIRAIGVKTDSDSTASSARADYDDLAFELAPAVPGPKGGQP